MKHKLHSSNHKNKRMGGQKKQGVNYVFQQALSFYYVQKKKKKGFTIASAFRKEKLRQRMKGSIISPFKCGILKYNIQSIFSKTFTPVMNADLSAKKKKKKKTLSTAKANAHTTHNQKITNYPHSEEKKHSLLILAAPWI